ncbi:hypothetical protein EKG37_09985 [Robertmurraya yapensis]|uniref:Uncharacterized protein n=1 Tax=Bacillus yapensis TaxID=2492960 RepID=A0A3S0LBY9_9BACI|nr:hypothetical protein EKG37_09985 [Bacillus yapensis]TKS95844.1 hypothetical protein FAR12_09985 [Bacillus yapensis]
MEWKALDSWGICGTDETPQELATRRLIARPPESKCLERKSTSSEPFLNNSNKKDLLGLFLLSYRRK